MFCTDVSLLQDLYEEGWTFVGDTKVVCVDFRFK